MAHYNWFTEIEDEYDGTGEEYNQQEDERLDMMWRMAEGQKAEVRLLAERNTLESSEIEFLEEIVRSGLVAYEYLKDRYDYDLNR